MGDPLGVSLAQIPDLDMMTTNVEESKALVMKVCRGIATTALDAALAPGYVIINRP
jgi:hypothetical protein